MIRLFKQVYLSPDTLFDWSRDRMVFSKNVGAEVSAVIAGNTRGDAYYYDEGWDEEDLPLHELIELADAAVKEDAPLIIYADEDSFPRLLITWMRTIAPNVTVDQVYELYQAEVYTTYHIDGRSDDDHAFEFNLQYPKFSKEEFESKWDIPESPQHFLQWIEENAESFELAFLLATYLSTGQYKDRVQKFFIKNVRHFVDRHLFDIKREVGRKVLYDDFAEKIGCQKYTLSNVDQIYHDKSPIMEALFGPRIFASKITHNSNKMNKEGLNINWDNITEEDMDNICNAITIADVPIGVDSIDEFRWLFAVATKDKLSDNDLDRILEREQQIKQTSIGDRDNLIDEGVCSALFIQHMLQQDKQYIDNLKII